MNIMRHNTSQPCDLSFEIRLSLFRRTYMTLACYWYVMLINFLMKLNKSESVKSRNYWKIELYKFQGVSRGSFFRHTNRINEKVFSLLWVRKRIEVRATTFSSLECFSLGVPKLLNYVGIIDFLHFKCTLLLTSFIMDSPKV
jgi:hypothetical protein